MQYPKSKLYDGLIKGKIMGPNPVKLTEELLMETNIPPKSRVLDLGSGQGITSVFLAKEYDFIVTAADLWSDHAENMKFFASCGLTPDKITAVKADANSLPFAENSFDAVICTDSYNYFGRDPKYLEKSLLPFVKHGGQILICVPGMKKDCHDNLPAELLAAWTPEQLDYIHDVQYWQHLIERTRGITDLSVYEMDSNNEVWNDWLCEENEYARGDRRAFDAGGGRYLNFVAITFRRE
ncbi:MAG TPA: class I SAM-dependent methyltransferase [Methanocorpusculum sp.]|nr:class I SAM-dependent methyltransferase [Methanocorpusculum sp.]